jgi:hypothetical protein
MPSIAPKNEHTRFLLLTLLILNVVARILQLFALIHGAHIYRSRGILRFCPFKDQVERLSFRFLHVARYV